MNGLKFSHVFHKTKGRCRQLMHRHIGRYRRSNNKSRTSLNMTRYLLCIHFRLPQTAGVKFMQPSILTGASSILRTTSVCLPLTGIARAQCAEQGLCNDTVSVRLSVAFVRFSGFAAVGPVGRRYRSTAAWPVPQQNGAAVRREKQMRVVPCSQPT